MSAVSGGKDALGGVLVHVQPKPGGDYDANDGDASQTVAADSNLPTYTGHGTSNDIIIASALSYVNALNKLIALGSTKNANKVDLQAGSSDRILDGKAI